LESWQSG